MAIRLGLIGWSTHAQRYAQHMPEVPGLELVALCRRDEAAGRQVAAERGLTYHRDHLSLLADPSLDGVIVAGPTDLHARMAMDALERGVPALVEKAVAHDLHAAEQLAAAAARTQGKIAVAQTLRFEPFADQLRGQLEALGPLVSVEIRHRSPVSATGRRYRFDGALLGGGVHFFDLLAYWGVTCLSRAEFGAGRLSESAFEVAWRDGPARFRLDLAWDAPAREELIRVEGASASLEHRRFELPRTPSIPPLLAAFRDYLADRAGPPVTLAEGIEAVRWVERVRRHLGPPEHGRNGPAQSV